MRRFKVFSLLAFALVARSFASPREFLLSGRPNVPACLVLDIKMPEVSGLEFQRALAGLKSASTPITRSEGWRTGHARICLRLQHV